MITSISWRNIWRNRRRSLVIIFSTILGVSAGIFMLAFAYGWLDQRIHDIVYIEQSSIKIHDSLYMETEDVNRFMKDVDQGIAQVREIDGVKAVSSQLVINSMLKIAQENMGAKINGINPDEKAKISELPDRMVYGTWFESDKRNPIVMSYKTAKRLGVIVYQIRSETIDSLRNLGLPQELLAKLDTFTTAPSLLRLNEFQFDKNLDRIVGRDMDKQERDLIKEQAFYIRDRVKINVMVQDTSGIFHEESFTLSGLYKTSNTMFDEMNVFIKRSDLERMTGLGPNDAHEIAILIENEDRLDEITTAVSSIFTDPNDKVETWKDLDPVGKYYSDSMGMYTYIFMGIILLALFFGIVNTMLMAVLERIKEIGMLKAVGMNSWKVFSMIVLESVFLTLTGSVFGIVLGMLLTTIFGIYPINLGVFGAGLEEFGFSAVIYTTIGTRDMIIVTILCIITGILASIAPAIKAVKLRPVEAIRVN